MFSLPAFASTMLDLDYDLGQDKYYGSETGPSYWDVTFDTYFKNTYLTQGDHLENYIRFDNNSTWKSFSPGYTISAEKSFLLSDSVMENVPSWSDLTVNLTTISLRRELQWKIKR